jgi:hypothetical protein
LGAGAQIQDSWVFSSAAQNYMEEKTSFSLSAYSTQFFVSVQVILEKVYFSW